MHRSPTLVDQQFVDAMLMHFSHAEFLELAFAVAQFISMGQLIHMLGLPNPAPRA